MKKIFRNCCLPFCTYRINDFCVRFLSVLCILCIGFVSVLRRKGSGTSGLLPTVPDTPPPQPASVLSAFFHDIRQNHCDKQRRVQIRQGRNLKEKLQLRAGENLIKSTVSRQNQIRLEHHRRGKNQDYDITRPGDTAAALPQRADAGDQNRADTQCHKQCDHQQRRQNPSHRL